MVAAGNRNTVWRTCAIVPKLRRRIARVHVTCAISARRNSAGPTESEVLMNTPRQPNARPGMAPFLGQSSNAVASSAPRSSFVEPFGQGVSPAAVENSGDATDEGPANDPVTRGGLK